MTNLELCNSALSRLGEARVYNLADTDFVTTQCNIQRPLALAEVLRAHRWNFAQARVAMEPAFVAIGSLSGGPVEIAVESSSPHGLATGNWVVLKDTGADGKYRVTVLDTINFNCDGTVFTDALTVGSWVLAPDFGFTYQYALPADCLRVVEVNGISGSGDPGGVWEVEGRKLLIDDDSVEMVYVKREEDLTLWDSLAIEWLTLLLAAKLAPTLQGGSTSKANELKEEIVKMTAPLARRIDANESRRGSENMMTAMLEGSMAIRAREAGV